MSQTKFKAIIFYKDEERLNKYLKNYKDTTPIEKFENMGRKNYIYEHFEIYCIKCDRIECYRGIKCDFIAIQKEILEYALNGYIEYVQKSILNPMLVNQKFDIDVKYF